MWTKMNKRLYKIPLENYFEIRKEDDIYAGFSNETNSWIDPDDVKGRLYGKRTDRSIENPKSIFFECLLGENSISKTQIPFFFYLIFATSKKHKNKLLKQLNR